MLKQQYKSGAAKRRQRQQKIVREVKRRRTLEELGWSVKSGNGEDAVDEPTSESETAPELQHEAADSVAQESSIDSDHSATGKSYSQLSPQQLS